MAELLDEEDDKDEALEEESDSEKEEPIGSLRSWTTDDVGSYFGVVLLDTVYFPMDHGFTLEELNLSAGKDRGMFVIRFDDEDVKEYQSKISYYSLRSNVHFLSFCIHRIFTCFSLQWLSSLVPPPGIPQRFFGQVPFGAAVTRMTFLDR